MAANRMTFFGLVLALLLSARVVLADTLTGRVVGVSDGDTITVLDIDKNQYKIRIAGIDAPGEEATLRPAIQGKPFPARLRQRGQCAVEQT